MDRRDPRFSFRHLFVFLATLASALAVALPSGAIIKGQIVRVDPRAGVNAGKPILTTVIEVVQFNSIAQALAPCADVRGFEASLACMSLNLEKPNAQYTYYPFPEANARLFVKVGGKDRLTKFESKAKWGDSQKEPGAGTAWLIALDASEGMGNRYPDARQIAHEFIEKMGPNDLIELMIFDDQLVKLDSKWKAYKDRASLVALLEQQKTTVPARGKDRPLFSQIKKMTIDAFGTLGNSDAPGEIPMHQAMVVISNGAGRNDTSSAASSAEVFHQYMNKGRFPEENTSMPRTPVPVISIWLPRKERGIVEDLYKNNDGQFMQALANPEYGGFFDVVQTGEGKDKAPTIVNLVRKRFNEMYIVKWRLSCLNPTVEQSFNLIFENTKPVIGADGSFKDVPLGVDPTQWPLDIDFERTRKDAEANPLFPGGTFRVYGDFCWSTPQNAEAYFIPAGTKPNAEQMKSRDPEMAKKAMQHLAAQNMQRGATEATETFVTFPVPDDDKVLEGQAENMVARVIVYDNNAHRASAVDEKSILQLKATKKPVNLLLILGIAGGVIVILLLLVVIIRGGGSKKRGGAPPPPAAGGGGYGGPGYYGGGNPGGGYGGPAGGGYGGPPPGYGMGGMEPAMAGAGGGYGAAPAYAAPAPAAAPPVPMAPAPVYAPPAAAVALPDLGSSAPPVIQVKCPACAMTTMATPGQPSVCFSCGQPLPAELTRGGGGGNAPAFPLTGAMAAQELRPPPNPYGAKPASAASLVGTAGQYSIRSGSEVRVGRDPAQCPIFLAEPRVSGVHATLKFDAGQLLVRDESSNNGTYVSGQRIPAGAWVPVSPGAPLKFGPIEFAVQLEP